MTDPPPPPASNPPPEPTSDSLVLAEISKQISRMNASIEAVRSELMSDFRGLQRQMKEDTTRTLSAHETTRRHVMHMSTMTAELWKEVFGNKPPPPPPDRDSELSFVVTVDPDPPPEVTKATGKHGRMRDRVDTQDATLDAVHGRLLALHSRQDEQDASLAELLKLQKEQMGKKDPNDHRSILARVLNGIAWAVKEREGQKFLLTLIAGISGLITAIGTTYAILTGRLPIPTPTPPVPVLAEPRPAPPALPSSSP